MPNVTVKTLVILKIIFIVTRKFTIFFLLYEKLAIEFAIEEIFSPF